MSSIERSIEQLSEVKEDLREIKSDVKAISETLIRNTASLEVHVKRTDMLEDRIETYETQVKWVLGIIATTVMSILVRLLHY
jgi:septal ring factor EnvC (AmiA/AmiB activator)